MSTIDARTLELMASKICHDLISPIGAINNGLEIFEEMGPEAGADVIELIASSAQIASAKLKAYRLVYGAGGADSNIRAQDIYNIMDGLLEHEKRLTQDWDPAITLGSEIPPKAFYKILTSLLLLTMDCLPKGGVLSVGTNSDQNIVVTGRGEGAAFRDGFSEALDNSANLEDLSPATTHAFMTGLLVKHYSYEIISVEAGDNAINFTFKSPSA